MAVNLANVLTTVCRKLIKITPLKINKNIPVNICKQDMDLEITPIYASNWSQYTPEGESEEDYKPFARMIGDTIRVFISVHRNATAGRGNIENETTADYEIKTLGYISTAYQTSFNPVPLGTMASFHVENVMIVGTGSEQVLSFRVRYNANHQASSDYTSYFPIQIVPNLEMYS